MQSFQIGNRMTKEKIRCGWVGENKPHYEHYHDEEWGIPSHNDQHLFEMLILEGAQAGLNWETILKKRHGYRKAFHQFDPRKVAKMSDDELESLLQDEGIIRNRLKVFSARKNALVFLAIQKEFGSFNDYLWRFTNGAPIQNHRERLSDIPTSTAISDALSKDLKKRGMSFVGSTIIYAYMQAIGMVNDHITSCWRYKKP
jgi:DNA-3-methyladenine glycosylase I